MDPNVLLEPLAACFFDALDWFGNDLLFCDAVPNGFVKVSFVVIVLHDGEVYLKGYLCEVLVA